MAAVAQEVEPVEVRAARLRERITADSSRVEEIGREIEALGDEIRTVTAAAVEANPTGEPGARAKTEIRKLVERGDALVRERTEIEGLLPHRGELLGRLDEEVRRQGGAELAALREDAEAEARNVVALLADQFSTLVATYCGPFADAIDRLAMTHHEANRRGVDWSTVEPPVGPVPVDLFRLVEMLSVAAGIRDQPPVDPSFAAACEFGGEGLGEMVAAARNRLNVQLSNLVRLPATSWASAHPEA